MVRRRFFCYIVSSLLVTWSILAFLLYRRWTALSASDEDINEAASSLDEFSSVRINSSPRHFEQQLEAAIRELDSLTDHNQRLLADLRNVLKIRMPNLDRYVTSSKQEETERYVDLSFEAEHARRRVETTVREIYYFLNAQLNNLRLNYGTNESDRLLYLHETFREQFAVALIELNRLKNTSNAESNREELFSKLARKVQQRLFYLQNPKSCSSARYLECDFRKACGFGCRFHHLLYCFSVAYATGRVLHISSANLENSTDNWLTFFLPSSNCTPSATNFTPTAFNAKSEMEAPIVRMPIVDVLTYRPNYLPMAIPLDIAPQLTTLHGNPFVWWCGQLARYLWRHQASVRNFLDEAMQKMHFESPIVGLHVRRTDKIGLEADFHTIVEYFEWVEMFFRQYELQNGFVAKKRVFIATDEPFVITEARILYPDYEILGDEGRARSGAVETRYAYQSQLNLLLDIEVLSHCDYLVCTFSSQVCRIAYELMQTRHSDATYKVQSLDDIYYFGGQNAHNYRALYGHKANEEQNLMELDAGDLLGMAGNHWDGHSKATNLRTGQDALFHTFKTEDVVNAVRMPFSYIEIDQLPPPEHLQEI